MPAPSTVPSTADAVYNSEGRAVMKASLGYRAEAAARRLAGCRRVLEVGYGMGFANRVLGDQGHELHVVVEIELFDMSAAEGHLIIRGDVMALLPWLRREHFDGVLWDVYPPIEVPEFPGATVIFWNDDRECYEAK